MNQMNEDEMLSLNNHADDCYHEVNDVTKPVDIFTEDYLEKCIKKVLSNLDHLKIDFYTLEIRCTTNKDAANTVDSCRKRLTSIIKCLEELNSLKNYSNYYSFICSQLDVTYKTLYNIKEELLQLDLKCDNTITQIEKIKNYANTYVRNVVLKLAELKATTNCHNGVALQTEIKFVKFRNKTNNEEIVLSSDSEIEVLDDKILSKKDIVNQEESQDIDTNSFSTPVSTTLAVSQSINTDDNIISDTNCNLNSKSNVVIHDLSSSETMKQKKESRRSSTVMEKKLGNLQKSFNDTSFDESDNDNSEADECSPIELDDSDDSNEADGQVPESQQTMTSKVRKKYKQKLLGIREILRSLI